MAKDFKTGMFLGLVFVIVIAVWFARNLRPDTQRKAINIHNTKSSQKKSPDKARFVTNLPGTTSSQYTPFEASKNKTLRFHIVNKGENLSMIAERYYGSPSKLKKILNANPHIKDPNKLMAGEKLKIP